MLWLRFVCVFFLFHPISVKLEKIPIQSHNIKNRVTTDNDDSVGDKTVTFNQDKFKVWMYKTETTNAFYTAVGCKFAEWTMHRLFELIKTSPTFYQSDSSQYTLSYEMIFVRRFQRSLTDFNIAIQRNVGQFVEILNNFVDSAKSNITYYNNSTLIKPLGSLIIKSHYLSAESTASSESDIVRLMIEEMTSVQKYLSTNCGQPNLVSTTPQIVQFSSYWIPNENYSDEYMNTFLTYMDTTIGVKSPRGLSETSMDESCLVPRMLLSTDIFNDQAGITSAVSFDIANANVEVNGTETLKLKAILKLAKTSYDIDFVFLYQDSFLTAIMKMIFNKVFEAVTTNKSLNEIVVKTIDNIKCQIFTEKQNYPKYFVEGFEVLAELKMYNSDGILQKLTSYSDSLNYCIKFPVKMCPVIKTDLSKDLTPYDKAYNNQFDVNNYLSIIFKKMLTHLNDFKCFNKMPEMFKRLHFENSKYYVPFSDVKRIDIPIDFNEKTYNNNHTICDFLINIYSHLYSSVVLINRSTRKHTEKAWNTIEQIKDIFLTIISIYLSDLGVNYNMDFLKIAYNVAIVLQNRVELFDEEFFKHSSSNHSMNRVMNMIMTEFDSFAIKYCLMPKFNLLMFNNINFFDFGGGKSLKSIKQDFCDQHVKNSEATISNLPALKTTIENILSVKHLYQEFIEKSKTCEYYGNHIQFYWEGKLATIQDLFQYSALVISNPNSILGLNDVYFKFYIGVFYYEMKRVLQGNLEKNIIRKGFDAIKNIAELIQNNFPKELHSIINNINNMFDFNLNNPTPSKYLIWLKNKRKEIDEQFNIINVHFEFEPSTSNKGRLAKFNEVFSIVVPCITNFTFSHFLIPPKTDHPLLKIEFIENVKRYYTNFLTLTKQPNFVTG